MRCESEQSKESQWDDWLKNAINNYRSRGKTIEAQLIRFNCNPKQGNASPQSDRGNCISITLIVSNEGWQDDESHSTLSSLTANCYCLLLFALMAECDCEHGERWGDVISSELKTENSLTLTFNFWNSLRNTNKSKAVRRNLNHSNHSLGSACSGLRV